MAIVPPLDEIPKLAGKLTNQLVNLGLKETDKLVDRSLRVAQDASQLPINCKCDDPRVKQIKIDLQNIQSQITKVQQIIPKVQQVINTAKTVVTIAQGVKTAITAAQLSNPATAGLFVAQQLQAIQDATIANVITCLKQLESYPKTLLGKLSPTIGPPIQEALNKLNTTCNGNIPNIALPKAAGLNQTEPADYNDLIPSQFYRDINVSEQDLLDRANLIKDLINRQLNVLTSLQEAPSVVFQQPGKPGTTVGKTGDYYVDTENLIFYGPKLSDTEWPPGINY